MSAPRPVIELPELIRSPPQNRAFSPSLPMSQGSEATPGSRGFVLPLSPQSRIRLRSKHGTYLQAPPLREVRRSDLRRSPLDLHEPLSRLESILPEATCIARTGAQCRRSPFGARSRGRRHRVLGRTLRRWLLHSLQSFCTRLCLRIH